MPFGDGTGPLGQGPRRGRGAGFCSNFDLSGQSGRGRGGRGWRNRQRAFGWRFGSPGEDDKLGALKAQAGFFQRALESICRRIEGLEAKAKPE
jgi:hypothetical protein